MSRCRSFIRSGYGLDPADCDSSDPWKALFFTLFICALLGLVGLILYKYRHKLTGKKQADQSTQQRDTPLPASSAAFTAVLLSHSGAPYPFLITSVRRRDTSKREISNEALFQMPRINCASSEALSSVETVTSSALPVWSVTMQKLHSLRAAALNVTRWISPPCGLDPSSRSLSLCLVTSNVQHPGVAFFMLQESYPTLVPRSRASLTGKRRKESVLVPPRPDQPPILTHFSVPS
ncbi:hypothetical protein PO909_025010 [Leuciscus waleckii]